MFGCRSSLLDYLVLCDKLLFDGLVVGTGSVVFLWSMLRLFRIHADSTRTT